ncbi:hypothetical protein BHM03_00000568 [Ensete ventricosum]|nr:hypothetical protein BHM03_00000568 [Ensete ventricosum]
MAPDTILPNEVPRNDEGSDQRGVVPTGRLSDSSSVHKAYARAVVEKRPRPERDPEITFKPREKEYSDHNDALVILAYMANDRVERIMVDTRSSTYILYFDAFKKLGLSEGDLIPMTSTLIGFTRDSISPLNITSFPITVREELRSKMSMVSFMVVKLTSAYKQYSVARPSTN